RVRLHAAHAIARINAQARVPLALFESALKDNDATVRRCAASLLVAVAREPQAVALVTAALGDRDAEVRRNAARSLGQFGPAARRLLPALGERLLDRNPLVQREAARAVQTLGKNAEPILPWLLRALRDPEDSLLEAAVELVQQLGKDFNEVLLENLKNREPAIRIGVLSYLGRAVYSYSISQASPAALAPGAEKLRSRIEAGLLAALQDQERDVRRAATTALRNWSRQRHDLLPALEKALTDADGEVKQTAALALAENDRLT